MNKDVGTILGPADRCMYNLGGTTICIDKLYEPPKGHSFHYVWQIRESKSHAKKRADQTGEPTFPQVHISVIKLRQAFPSHGKALISAIYYLNQKRREGEL